MQSAFLGLTRYPQFVTWKSITKPGNSKPDKIPVHPKTHEKIDGHKPSNWMSYEHAEGWADYDKDLHVGFMLSDNDPFWFLDIDGCLKGGQYSEVAKALCSSLGGAAMAVSSSGTGLHVIGSGRINEPNHMCKNSTWGLEFYHTKRLIALWTNEATGDVLSDHSQSIPWLLETYFKRTAKAQDIPWSSEPVPEYTGPEEDEELISKALAAQSNRALFGDAASFADLWHRNVEALGKAYPDGFKDRDYDDSMADGALASHLAFWTGKNHERILRLMWQSGLKREKWDRDQYLRDTIAGAVNIQQRVYDIKPAGDLPEEYNAPKLRASSEKQEEFANNVRAGKLGAKGVTPEQIAALCDPRGITASAKFWIDNRDKTVPQLCEAIQKIERAGAIMLQSPERLTGVQYMPADLQVDHFKGCVYVQEDNAVFTPSGDLLKREQFNATYGGYQFQIEEATQKSTRRAWEAFTESQCVRFPKVHGTIFRPVAAPGAMITEEGRFYINTYVDIEVPRKQGDPSPFLRHLANVLPVQRDQDILLAYMAACVQHKGVKFHWAPLIQGTPGNGKTLFTYAVMRAVGKRYSHLPKAMEIDNKFNAWLDGIVFAGIEDVYVPESKRVLIEVLKPMITGEYHEVEPKGKDQRTVEVCANFILNTNHRDAIAKTEDDRRFCVFFSAQQSREDMVRCGMFGEYLPRLYDWLKREDGFAIVSEYLHTYNIPEELNPAGSCQWAPETSSTGEVIHASRGSVEQEVLEAIHEGRQGFCGGWISSMALDRLLRDLRMARMIPHNRRREMLRALGYDWHPGLKNGRVNNYVLLDSGKPRLFVCRGHASAGLTNGADIVRAYEDAQGAGSESSAAPPLRVA